MTEPLLLLFPSVRLFSFDRRKLGYEDLEFAVELVVLADGATVGADVFTDGVEDDKLDGGVGT